MQYEENKFVVIPLLFLAMFSMLFMFSVSYTNASFERQERPFPELFSPRQISPAFDRNLTIIADNLVWSFETAGEEMKPMALSFFGLDGYKFGQPRQSSVARVNPFDLEAQKAQVLGARYDNPEYAVPEGEAYGMDQYYR